MNQHALSSLRAARLHGFGRGARAREQQTRFVFLLGRDIKGNRVQIAVVGRAVQGVIVGYGLGTSVRA